ncbi:hypothetical protein H6P81_016524 [Aristolochia fimbriata]|uniref:DUF7725 domain-containing protein n=1 Tax=Aristolochia fimbriata TaxID=158543 RepID=A0AAV7E980_ARIFI|nr:hypothetical protein H6P81_016524 [Aristolochia fimbriata]
MEAAAGVAAGRGGSLPMPSPQSSRKEWRAVSNSGTEELDRSKMGQSDERTIYEVQQGAGPVDVDFCSITVDGGSNDDLLQQRLHGVSRQREELQQLEVELRAQLIARAEMMEMQKNFDTQIKEHVSSAAKLKEQLQEREQCIRELERKMEEKDRELRAIKIDNEAAWAKEDLLREQNKELATFRRERDNSEAERAQHLKQIHDLKEHIHEKENHYLELEEQHRAAQETLLYKDEQLREAQAWVARAQERDALQSTTIHSLQAELRELWLGCQRQVDMERLHLQTIQQLQLELAETRERSGISTEESQSARANSKDVSLDKGSNFNISESGSISSNSSVLQNGGMDNAQPLAGNASTKTDHIPGVTIVPSPIMGMGAFIPPGQMTTLHPFVMHQQSVPHSLTSASSQIPQSHMGHFQPIPAISPQHHWPNQQAAPESSQLVHQTYQPSLTEQSLLRTDTHYDYEVRADGQVVHSDFVDVHISSQQRSNPVITSSSSEQQVLESNEHYLTSQKHQGLQERPSQIHDTLRLDPYEQKELKVNPEINSVDKSRGIDSTSVPFQQQNDENVVNPDKSRHAELSIAADQATTDVNGSCDVNHQVKTADSAKSTSSNMTLPDMPVCAGRTSSMLSARPPQPALLDERSLLACIVRAIPAGSGGQVRISTTLPNRLGKMLAPLHWHDYKKQYGKLDEFVARHPELFVIEGDFVRLREGAHEIISATTAAAKVAAAAAAVSAPYTSLLPSVAVTPVAQAHRLKRVPSANSSSDASEKRLQDHHANGMCYNIVHGLSNVKILSKPKDLQELNALPSEVRTAHSPVNVPLGNGLHNERTAFGNFQNKGSSNGRHGLNSGGKQQGRASGAGVASRRY